MRVGGDPVPWLARARATTTPAGSRLSTDVAHAPVHTHHVRYHHTELCPPWRMRTRWGPPWGSSTTWRRSHSHASGRRPGSTTGDHLAQIALACEWEETRFHDWLAITPPPRQKAQGCLLTWRMRPRTHHVRYHHAELCPTWRIRT